MITIDEMLRAPAEEACPPVVRWAKARLDAGDELKVEVCKPDSAWGSPTIDLFILWKEGGVDRPPQQYDWEDELNTSLVNLGVRAVDLTNESVRFVLKLRTAFRKIEKRYGDGYLNSVLVDLIDESELSKGAEILPIRTLIRTNSLDKTSRAYSDCREQIAREIGARAVELRNKLKYEYAELKTIMSKAIAQYLDERFSVTRRRLMGLS